MKEDPTIKNLASYVPVVQMPYGDELIILCFSVPICKNRRVDQSKEAARFVVDRVVELIRIRNITRLEENEYVVRNFTENQSSSFNPYKVLSKLAVEDPSKLETVVKELEDLPKIISNKRGQYGSYNW